MKTFATPNIDKSFNEILGELKMNEDYENCEKFYRGM